MRVSLVAALSSNRVIGLRNRLPWHLPEELKYFRNLTRGKPVIMGRKTYESIGKPLPDRLNLIVSRRSDFSVPGATVCATLESALSHGQGQPEVMILGGAEIYAQALPNAHRLYLTLIDREIKGDAFFPEWRESGEWKEIASQPAREGEWEYRFTTWERLN